MEEVNLRKIEKKWQKNWEEFKIFEVKKNLKKRKYYILEMFPYPSGEGLHVGHALNYIIGDVYSRFKIMNGFNVLHPMGYDSLGLPAENASIKEGVPPEDYTKKSIKNFIKQQKSIGLTYDWSRMINTSDSDYYKWDQWIFLKLFEKGLAYKKESPVNWCPKCNTVLANEQVHNGKCWRHEETNIEIKHLNQWYFKITDYANELNDFSGLKKWPENIKKLQKNWIGKSFGTEINFEINGMKWPIFTTRPDTIYGVTFMVISAQHHKLFDLVTKDKKKEVEKFVKKLNSVSEEDINQLEKEGVFTGAYAINPINKEKIPVYAGNFVLADYGCGMVMAVPAHDQRDFEFAKKYNIFIRPVIQGRNIQEQAYVEEGDLINSDKFNGLNNEKAKVKITDFLEKRKLGKKAINFKLRDWLISRQRYWGAPIPIINCEKCGAVPISEKDLPIKLPKNVKFGKGNPLETAKEWINVKCPKCGKPARRETDTMDTFVNSSWYYLRYCDSKNKNQIFNKEKINYWGPIDFYIGGKEHACMHLIYIRFYTKFLRDLGLLNFDEPAIRLFNQGMVYGKKGNKMSKSQGNIVDPLKIIERFSADALRIFEVSVASPESNFNWEDKGVKNIQKFLNRIWVFFNNVKIGNSSEMIESKMNKTILEVTENIENLKYNLAIIKLRKLFKKLNDEKKISKEVLEIFLKLLCPFCPHISEELWERLGNKKFLSLAKWPESNKNKINKTFENQEEIIEKIINDINHIKNLAKINNPKTNIYTIPSELDLFIQNKNLISKNTNSVIVNVYSTNDKKISKYDPENKSKKAKPGKPGIYIKS